MPACIEPSTKGMGIWMSPGTVMAPMAIAEAAVTEATEAIDPTEMSSMPATMTTVSPMARRPTMTIDWLRLFMRFCQLRNNGCSQTMTAMMPISARTSERLSTPTALIRRRSVDSCPSGEAGAADGPLPPPALASASAGCGVSVMTSPLYSPSLDVT